eukprot:TRINITY_DN3853_c0_g1_i5.p2 TRINITY_DN3853_c0_g1~~TRINITY_DN3853_c0_g1_i5.p2  ORF type:complete len:107 (-),score=6.60 TRINITY_DN3853_c0_g1_i5:126-446(-)
MVQVKNWDEFFSQAEYIFRNNPLKTRYMLKYRHCDGNLVLKVTDNVLSVYIKTDQQSDMYRLEKLNSLFMDLAVHGPDYEVPSGEEQTKEESQETKDSRRKPRRRG